MSQPRAIAFPSQPQSVFLVADSSLTGLLTATMWGQQAIVQYNGVMVPVEGVTIGLNEFSANDRTMSSPELIGVQAASTRLYGNFGSNFISGGAGTDFINGFGGSDNIRGYDGNDIYVYSARYTAADIVRFDDFVVGQLNAGQDMVLAQQDFDLGLEVGAGNPRFTGIEDVRLAGGYAQAVTATGDEFNNKLEGNEFDNVLNGLGGADQLFGYAGDDDLFGGNGVDGLSGGTGNDSLYGGQGNDRLTGGVGNDVMDGGTGADRFVFGATAFNTADVTAGAQDTIVNGAGDRIDFNATFEALLNHFGTNLGSAETDITIGSQFGDGGNVRFADGQLQIDLNSDGQFIAADDFAIALGGVTTVSYNAQGDYFLLG